MNLDRLLALPKSGVIILTKGNSVLVSYTASMGAELLELYNQFNGQSGITIKVVSVGADLETMKLHTEYCRRLYHNELALKPIIDYSRKTLSYRVRAVPTDDLKYIDVQLVTTRGDSKIVGRFRSAKESKDFMECYY